MSVKNYVAGNFVVMGDFLKSYINYIKFVLLGEDENCECQSFRSWVDKAEKLEKEWKEKEKVLNSHGLFYNYSNGYFELNG